MKLGRLLAVLTAAAFIAAIPLSNMVLAGQEGKVDICHFPDGKEEGIVISVSGAALDTHLTMHGDTTSFIPEKGGRHCIRNCKKAEQCKKGEVFNPKLCRCVPSGGCEQQEKCQPGEVWDSKKCQCVPDGNCEKVPDECPKGTVWDTKLCKCVIA